MDKIKIVIILYDILLFFIVFFLETIIALYFFLISGVCLGCCLIALIIKGYKIRKLDKLIERKFNKKKRKEILNYFHEQMACLEDAFAPSIEESIKHIKEKFGLKDIYFRYRIKWNVKIDYE